MARTTRKNFTRLKTSEKYSTAVLGRFLRFASPSVQGLSQYREYQAVLWVVSIKITDRIKILGKILFVKCIHTFTNDGQFINRFLPRSRKEILSSPKCGIQKIVGSWFIYKITEYFFMNSNTGTLNRLIQYNQLVQGSLTCDAKVSQPAQFWVVPKLEAGGANAPPAAPPLKRHLLSQARSFRTHLGHIWERLKVS